VVSNHADDNSSQSIGRHVHVLYNCRELANAVKDVLSTRGRRLVISAYVGEGAQDYLPRPKGATLICWPQAGGTNPNAVSKLLKSGVKVFFADNLHMKLYHGQGRGAVVSSANLTRNGLGGGLKEIGVRLPPGAIDIDKVLSSIARRKWTLAEHERLVRQTDLFWRRNPPTTKRSPRANSYAHWYLATGRPPWKLGWWDAYGEFSRDDIEWAKTKGLPEPDDYIPAERTKTYEIGDWVLTFRLSGKEKHHRVSDFKWLFIDKVIRDKADRKSEYPFHAVQLRDWRGQGLRPPFVCGTDFKRCFAAAATKIRLTPMKGMTLPTHGLLRLLRPCT
jgi:hypothetical protein